MPAEIYRYSGGSAGQTTTKCLFFRVQEVACRLDLRSCPQAQFWELVKSYTLPVPTPKRFLFYSLSRGPKAPGNTKKHSFPFPPFDAYFCDGDSCGDNNNNNKGSSGGIGSAS